VAKSKSKVEELESRLTTAVPRTSAIPDLDWLSSGITTLNLAASGRPDGLIPKGKYAYVVGDSSSGKSRLVQDMFAEAARNPSFAKHRLVFDNAERGMLLDVAGIYGQETADRIEPPRGTKTNPEYSETVQQFFFNLDDALGKGPCIYALDSVDAIGADEDDKQFQAEKDAFEKDKESPGTYAMSKVKYISQHIGRVSRGLSDTGSILLLISQTRDKIGGHIPGQKTRAGGRALKFYARLELWLSVKGPMKKTVLGREREIGSYIQVDIQKNHLTGWEGKVPLIPFQRNLGFDSIGSSVDFLLEEGVWDKQKNTIKAPELEFEGTRDALIKHIENNNLESKLVAIVQAMWSAIEDASKGNRKSRYGL